VYAELANITVEGDQCVSIWACDREAETDEKEMKKVEWRSCDMAALQTTGVLASVSVDGFHMCATKSEGYQGQPCSCVAATESSTLSLARCNLTSESDGFVATVGISGGASGNLNKCCLRDGRFGIAVMSKGKATLEDNDVHSNAYAGVIVQGEGSKAVVRKNHIYDGKEGGVVIGDKATATLEDNDIHSNAYAGVHVEGEGSEVVMRKNRIYDGKQGGVMICEKATATLDDNTIQSNDLEGIYVAEMSLATLTNNRITGNGHCTIQRTPDELAEWIEGSAARWLAGRGCAGVFVDDNSTVSMLFGSNTIEGNGKEVEQVVMDSSSQYHPQDSQPRCAMSIPI
jgi:parallel beta-helix repeat protein